MFRQGFLHHLGMPHRDRPQNGPRYPHIEDSIDIGGRAQPPAELHRQVDLGQHPLQSAQVARTRLAQGTIEIHHVQPLGSLQGPPTSGFYRIVGKDCLGPQVAPQKAHATPAAQVDGGVDDHGCFSNNPAARAKLRRMLSPTSWLFSGWN